MEHFPIIAQQDFIALERHKQRRHGQMVMPKARKAIALHCRRWFQKSQGNTYHRATVIYDDGTQIHSGIRYGYGDHCLHTGIGLILDNDDTAINKDAYKVGSYTIWLREQGIIYTIADVARKRDL